MVALKSIMYVIAAIGFLTILLSMIMIASPSLWSRGILSFAQKPYFHVAEIASRLFLGGILVIFAGETSLPSFITVIGCVFVFAGAFLIIAGAKRHRDFAVKSATFTRIFRPDGIAGVFFGAAIVWIACATRPYQ